MLRPSAIPEMFKRYSPAQVRKRLLFTLLAVVLIEGYWAVFIRHNDFRWHYRLGSAFLGGDPYALGGDWYPLGRAMIDGALAALPYQLARALTYLLAVAATGACFFMWNRMASASWPGGRETFRNASVLVLLILFPYIIRDLDECGLQLLLLFFLSAGAYALFVGRSVWSGFWLAVAVTYKSTPILFLPFLLYKRQWRAAASMAVLVVVLNMLPAVFLGWNKTVEANGQWFARATETAKQTDPIQNGVEPPNIRNQGLKISLARYLQSQPESSPLYLAHPLFIQFGEFSTKNASRVIQIVLLLFVLVLAWRFRGRWPSSASSGSELPSEWAAVTLLCAILSPLCWKHHLVLGIPCLLITVRAMLSNNAVGVRWRWVSIGLIAAIVVLSRRFVLGRELSLVVQSYKLDTVAILLAMLLVLTLPSHKAAGVSTESLPDDAPDSRPSRLAA